MISLVGLGPGSTDCIPPQARHSLRSSDVILGYRGYLDSIQEWLEPAEPPDYRPYELGEELDRADDAIRLAQDHVVSLVSSGDAGVYGMGAALFEQLETTDHPTPEVQVIPGITALTAAAARLGAPVGQDFAAISLSDLLTPLEVIERRVRSAAEGDFVLSLYNPRSSSRTEPLEITHEILLDQYGPDRPVGIVRNAYRENESSELVRLGELPREQIDMFTTLIVGNSRTRINDGWMYTPRGYTS